MEIQRKRNIKKPIVIVLSLILLLAAGVLGAGWFQSLGAAKQNARNVADEVLKSEDALKQLLDKSWESLEDFSDEDKQNIAAIAWPKNDWAPRTYIGMEIIPDEISQKVDHINTVYQKLNDVHDFSYIADAAAAIRDGKSAKEQYEHLAKSGSTELARKFGQDMLDYLEKIDKFKEKYADKTDIDELKMQEDYGVVQNLGVELTKKYEKVSFEDIVGISREEIDSLFEDARAIKAWAE